MVVTGSPFCEHKKLRMSCPDCKAAAMREAIASAPKSTPFTSRDEDEPRKTKAAPKLGGAAKPLMPTRARKKPVTAAEAERAQAWWVKKPK